MAVEAKICGVMRPEDAAWAAQQGAARIGVVLAWGRRVVSPELAREIAMAAGGVPVIGVLGPGGIDAWLDLAGRAGLAGVQLHGGSTPAQAEALRAAGLEVWRVATIGPDQTPEAATAAAMASADAVLVEPATTGRGGGLGIRLDSKLARQARKSLQRHRMVLAGGLDPDNVAEAIHLVGPDLVDVSSGVELSTGIKDKERVTRFLEAVRDTGSPTRRGH